MASIVTLTTDFGLSDAFVGAMKGVILSRCPAAQLVDLTHEVPPQAIRTGALRLASAAPYFPAGTVHLVVVDPGVGGDRRPLAIEARGHFLVGPDNGVLSLTADPSTAGWRAVVLTNLGHRLEQVSNTFHGRDVFAPAAAHLACGGRLDDLGDPVTAIVRLRLPPAVREADQIHGLVLDIDRFGNLITNIHADDLAGATVVEIAVADVRIDRLSRSYDPRFDVVAVIDGDDRLEIASPGGSAARKFDVALDTPVVVQLSPSAGR